MKGGVIPRTVRELEDRISRIQRQYGSRFPIQSQHEGNCASDAIQIILSFSDGIGEKFAENAIEVFLTLPNAETTIYDDQWIVDRLGEAQAGANLFQALGDIYTTITSIRFLRLIDEYEERLQGTGFGLARMASQGATIERNGVRSDIGVLCSSVFAVANRRLETPTALLARRGPRNMLYGYSPENYDPIVDRVLENVAPGARLVTGPMTRREGEYEITYSTPELERMVGVQFFFLEERVNVALGRRERGFHTLSFFKYGGRWYIGDNEVGFSIPLPEGFTTHTILTRSFSFEATAPNSPDPDTGLYRYVRIYYSHEIDDLDNTLDNGVEIGRATYYLTSPTSGTYLRSYEDTGARNEMIAMPRKYFIPPPGAAAGAPTTTPAVITTTSLGGYLRNTNPGDTILWNLIPSSITLYPTAAGAGGAAGIQAYAAKFVTNDGIYGIRITQGGSGGYGGITTNYKLNKTQNRQEQYITVNGVDLYLEPIAGAPAVRPATADSGVAMFAEARRSAREARAAAAAPVTTTPLGFGFPGTMAAATVTPVTTATPAPTSYGFPTTLGQYYKSTEQAPPGFYVGNTLALANANTNVVETNGLLFFFMTEPSTNDIIAVFRVGEDQYQAYKIARNRSPDTTMVSGNVYLAGIRDPAIMQAAYNRAQEVKREQAAALASAARREEELRFRFPGLSTPPSAPEPRVSGLSDDPFGIRAIHERFAGRGRRKTRRARKTRPTRRRR